MKVKMYRGIDQNDGEMSLFAVTTDLDGDKIVAASTDYGENDPWRSPTPFLKLAEKEQVFLIHMNFIKSLSPKQN